ncbi:ABC transporter ATP-binding protein [Actinopolymorpha sp. B11F2]|uniref:ABC transporter ATP-binding protein n=1 Tax=Actinopolymorpha sp. B11F2 TaxID=3160862 RepID=UPI0032E50FB5
MTGPRDRRPFTLRALWLMVSLAFRADPVGAFLLCLTMPTYYLSPAAGAVATKLLVDAALRGQTAMVAWAAVFAGFAVLAAAGSLKLEVYLSYTIDKKVNALVQRRVAEMLVRLPGVEHYERPDHLDEVQQLRDNAGELGSGLLAALNMFGQVCQVVVVCALLAAQTPLLLLLPLFAVPSFLAAGFSNTLTKNASEESAESERMAHRIVGMASQLPVARETRLFGLGDEWRDRHRRLVTSADRIQGSAYLRSTLLGAAGNLLFAVGYFGAVLLVINRATSGELSAGDVALTVVLAGQAHGFISGLVDGTKFLAGIFIVAARMDWLTAYERNELGARASDDPHPAPTRIAKAIRLEELSFRYPGTERPVLHDVSLELPSGAVVALVGENGAGKSSLVKLLLGYYAPTSGRILLDETDLATIDVGEWRSQASGAFQDYCRFEFLARESIGMGKVEDIVNEAQVLSAAQRAGADQIVTGLPKGPETQLGADWEGGTDLSGGQWQRIALARSMMRAHPLLLVLDEPTAALDAQAEHELFQSFAAAAADTGDAGGITVLVTHRFSTVTMADVIIVLADGRVAEIGDHSELISRKGLYAELFDLQASAYR